MARRRHTVLDQCDITARWRLFAWVRCGRCGDWVRREWVWMAYAVPPLPVPAFVRRYGCWRCFETKVAFVMWLVERGWRSSRPPPPPAPPGVRLQGETTEP